MFLCQSQHSLLALVACITVNTIQSFCALTGRNQEGQHPVYLPLGHCTDIQQSLTQNQAVAYMEESMPLLCVYLISQAFLQQGILLWGWGALASFKPLLTAPIMAPSNREQTVSQLWWIGTQLRASAAPLSAPFWYSKANSMRPECQPICAQWHPSWGW